LPISRLYLRPCNGRLLGVGFGFGIMPIHAGCASPQIHRIDAEGTAVNASPGGDIAGNDVEEVVLRLGDSKESPSLGKEARSVGTGEGTLGSTR
jgi:hypothetical protein